MLSLSALGYEYVYDDKTFIVANPRMHEWSGLARAFVEHAWAFDASKTEGTYYRPLLVVWLALGQHLFGGSAGHHAMSIVLHAVAISLVYRVGRALGLRELACLAAAAVFALHPVQIQAVAWVSAANDLLLAVLLLSSLWCWLAERRVLAVVLFLAATLSVERAFPFVLVPLWLAITITKERRVRVVLPFAGVLGVVLVVRALVLHGPRTSLAMPRTLATLPSVLARYAWNLAWPSRLSLAYPETLRSEGVLLGLAVLVALLGLAFAIGRTRSVRAFLVGAFAIMFAAPLQVAMLPSYALVQDRYLYLPLAFAALLVGDLLFPPERARSAFALAGGAWLLALVVFFPRNHAIWRNELALYARATEVAPGNALFLMNYANAVKRTGADDNCAMLTRARDAALASPTTADPALVHYNLGNCLREHSRAREAIASYDAALGAARGYFTAAAINRVVALLDLGDVDEASRSASLLVARSDTSAAWRVAGIVAARRRDFAEAIRCFERGKALAPNDRSFDALLDKARSDAR